MNKEYEEEIRNWKILSYDQLPDFDLYIDQLIHVVDQQMLPLKMVPSNTEITASMVNNYVKHDLLPPPKKKRYGKKHLAILIVISFLKSVFSIGEIKKGIEMTLENREYGLAYDEFCLFVENGIKKYLLGEGMELETDNKALYYACESLASKLFVQNHLENEHRGKVEKERTDG